MKTLDFKPLPIAASTKSCQNPAHYINQEDNAVDVRLENVSDGHYQVLLCRDTYLNN